MYIYNVVRVLYILAKNVFHWFLEKHRAIPIERPSELQSGKI